MDHHVEFILLSFSLEIIVSVAIFHADLGELGMSEVVVVTTQLRVEAIGRDLSIHFDPKQ